MVMRSFATVRPAMFEGLRFKHWKTSVGDDGIVVLTLDREGASANALSREVLDELDTLVERLAIENPKGVVIHSAKPSGFAVGADIREFVEYAQTGTVLDNIENGQRVFENLARLPCPTVAAIHGACMGGGTELALACRLRIAADDDATKIGLPEVMLGIHPGWGGSARLPRLIGAPDALPAMLTGKPFNARRAKARGLGRSTSPVPTNCWPRPVTWQGVRSVRPFAQRAKAWATNTLPVRADPRAHGAQADRRQGAPGALSRPVRA